MRRDQVEMRKERIINTVKTNPGMTAAMIAERFGCLTCVVRRIATEIGVELKAYEHLTRFSRRKHR